MATSQPTADGGRATIDAQSRQVLYEDAKAHLECDGFDLDKVDSSKRMRRRVETLGALLDEIGWNKHDRRRRYRITLTPALVAWLRSGRRDIAEMIQDDRKARARILTGDEGYFYCGAESIEESVQVVDGAIDSDLEKLYAYDRILTHVEREAAR